MIELVDLKKRFDVWWVTNGVNLKIYNNKTTCIIGRSGEGKSVLLKQIIGLIQPTSGQIIVNNVDITNFNKKQRYENYKNFGYVFQFAALLDSLNVFENIGISLLEQGMKKGEVLERVKEKLSLVALSQDVLYKSPSSLSGGMRKRVGLARTLMVDPKVILYDEPTTGLDPITARVIHELMSSVQKRLNATSVIISHDVEIFKYSDYVALLFEGQIKYFGEAKTIWQSENPYIKQFIHGEIKGPIQTEIAHTPGNQ